MVKSLSTKYDYDLTFINFINQLKLHKNYHLNDTQGKEFVKIADLKIDTNDILESSQFDLVKNFFNFFDKINKDTIEEILLTDNFKATLTFWFTKMSTKFNVECHDLLSNLSLFDQCISYKAQDKKVLMTKFDIFLSTLFQNKFIFYDIFQQVIIIYFQLLDHIRQHYVQQA